MTNEVLVAVPLFIFMGAVLERSKIAEALLETMGQLFGLAHDRDGEVRWSSAEHVGEHDNAVPPLALSRISARRFSMSSSAPMQTAIMHCCGPHDMLQGGNELPCQIAVSDQCDADHSRTVRSPAGR
jgi:hypothetical protein